MRKATLVLATSVAFLVSGTAFAVTGSKTSTIASAADLILKGTVTDANGNLRVQSPPVSGVYIPAGAAASTEVAVATRTAGTIAKAAVGTAVKAAARANGAVFAAQGAIAAATAAVDWLQKDGSYVKKSDGSSAPDVKWLIDGVSGSFDAPRSACDAYQAQQAAYDGSVKVIRFESNGSGSYTCTIANESGSIYSTRTLYQSQSCKAPTFLDSTTGRCEGGQAGYVSLTEQDYNDLGDWVQQQDGTFVRQAAIEGCSLAVNPEACFQTIVPDRQLTGPASITGPSTTTSKTVSTTAPDGTTTTGTATTTTTPGASITYNNNTTNNITYNTYDKTVTKNPDGSTTETNTDEGPPNVPDLTDKPFEPIGGLPADIAATGATGASLPFLAWFSMGGQCREHTFMLPVLGALTTNYCPIHEAYVRPFLYFIFSVWTFMYCFQIWRESTVRVRIM